MNLNLAPVSSAEHSKAVVLLLLIHCLLLPPLFCGGLWLVRDLLSRLAIVSLGKKIASCFTLIAFKCHLTVSVLCFFVTLLQVGLQFLNVAFSSHTHLFFHVIC